MAASVDCQFESKQKPYANRTHTFLYLHVYWCKTQSHYRLSVDKECELGLNLSSQVHCKQRKAMQRVAFFSTFVLLLTMVFLFSFFFSSWRKRNIGCFKSTEMRQLQNYLPKKKYISPFIRWNYERALHIVLYRQRWYLLVSSNPVTFALYNDS